MTETAGRRLWVVMPVYNEAAAVANVLAEWLSELRGLGVEFRAVAINDGSTDATPELLHDLARANPELEVHDRPNSGHGQSCAYGYRVALRAGADWVLQVDSDGQCDARYLGELWQASVLHPVVFGRRIRRDDGWWRWWISRAVSLVVWVAAGRWVADANVPYRLVRRDALQEVMRDLAPDIHLVNVLLALRLAASRGIHWIPIRFRRRLGARSSVAASSLPRRGVQLFRQLRRETAARARWTGSA